MKILKSNLGLTCTSILIALLFVEVTFSLVFKKTDNLAQHYHLAQQRYMLFEQGDVFNNVDNFLNITQIKKYYLKHFTN